jgi:hypothetical protein
MSIHNIAAFHGVTNTEFFNEIYTETVVVNILQQNYGEDEFNRHSYRLYCEWYDKNFTKLGKALK